MDIIMSMISMVKDINSLDREYRNLNLQLKYELQKANITLNKCYNETESTSFMLKNLRRVVKEAEVLTKKLDQLLNTSSITIKDKIRLSLPFSQTKNQVVFVIETLQKIVNDIKGEGVQETRNENKQQGMKRNLTDILNSSNISKNMVERSTESEKQIPQIDEQIEQVLMGPTIQEDEMVYSQQNKPIQFTISIKGFPQILQVLQKEQKSIIQTKITLDESKLQKQIILYTVARVNFQKCYTKLKAVTKDIDRISTKSHFHIVVKRDNSNHLHQINIKKQDGNMREGDKTSRILSFPHPSHFKGGNTLQFNLFARKEDANKALYQQKGIQWLKIQENEKEILNGERLAAFLNPQTKQPSIYFEVNYKVDDL